MNAPTALRPAGGAEVEADRLLFAPSLERRRLQCYLALIVTDIAAILFGYGAIAYIHLGASGPAVAYELCRLALPIYLTVALYNNAYSRDALQDPWHGIWRAEIARFVMSGSIILIAFFTKSSGDFSRMTVAGGGLGAMMFLMWGRLQMRSFIAWRCGANVVNELIIEDGGPRIDLPHAIRVSAPALGLTPDLNDPHSLDRVGLALRNIDRVIISCPAERRSAWAMTLKGANIEGEVLDDQVVSLGAQGARVVGDHGLLLVSAGPLGLRSRAVKRLFDLVIAAGVVVVLSPLLLVVALAIKLEDGGPVIFIQRRMGQGNRFFNIYKFRSMAHALADPDGNTSTGRTDARITRVGHFIRGTSIDELPQLFNVLLGDMSLVGPRPHAIGSQAGDKHFWEVDLRYWQRHCLKPGLSGLAQVRGYRGATEQESDLVQRLQSDLEYLEGWTILRDIKILFLTLKVLVHDRAF
jgi:polysaccharide biosynthesis protein PslA